MNTRDDHVHQRLACVPGWGIALTALLAIAAVAAGQDSLEGLPATPAMLGTPADQNDPTWGKPRVAPLVAKVIEPEELRSYALVLHLSEPQRAALRETYLAYRKSTDSLYAKHNDPIATLAVEAADTQAHPYDWEYLRLLTELRGAEVEIQRELIKEDQAFLSSVQLMLSEPQKAVFERVELRRARKRC